MSVEIHIIPQLKLFLEISHGLYTYDDLVGMRNYDGMDELVAEWGADMLHLNIALANLELNVGQADMKRATQLEPFVHEMCRRVIVAHDDGVYGVARQFVSFRANSVDNFKVFKTVPEALTFLGLSRETFNKTIAPLIAQVSLT